METKSTEGKKEHATFYVSQKVLFYHAEEKKFLLLKAKDMGGGFCALYGPWDLPGGRINEDEDIDSALEREVVEEIGSKMRYKIDNKFGLLGRTKFYFPSIHKSVVVLCFLSLYHDGDIELSDEHTEYKWFTADEVEQSEELKPWLKEFVRAALERMKEREYLNDAKRMYADFENYKRRQEERMKELSAMCVEGVALDMIPVLDNFRAAGAHVPEEEKAKAWMTGITYIGKQLEDALASHGLVAYEAKEGEMFDPYLHEAVSHDEQGGEDGKIVKALQPGYKMGTKVIRPAKVIVA